MTIPGCKRCPVFQFLTSVALFKLLTPNSAMNRMNTVTDPVVNNSRLGVINKSIGGFPIVRKMSMAKISDIA